MTRTFRTIYAALLAIVVGVMLANGAMAGERLSRSFDDLTWVEAGPGLKFARLWGDWDKGDYGMIVNIKAGQTVARHSHTADYHGVTIRGNWVHTYGLDDERVQTPGSYAFQSGQEDHEDRCEGPEDCFVLIHQQGPRDFIMTND